MRFVQTFRNVHQLHRKWEESVRTIVEHDDIPLVPLVIRHGHHPMMRGGRKGGRRTKGGGRREERGEKGVSGKRKGRGRKGGGRGEGRREEKGEREGHEKRGEMQGTLQTHERRRRSNFEGRIRCPPCHTC